MKNTILAIAFVIPFAFNTIQAKSGSFKEAYDAKDVVKIELDVGSLALTSNSSDEIDVECNFDLTGDAVIKPSVTVKKNYLKVEGDVKGPRENEFRAKVNWIITVPHGTKVKFEAHSGGVIIENFKGEFVGNTKSGGIEISNCSAAFSFNTHSGDINANDVTLNDKSEFSTSSGDVMVRLSESPDSDLSVSTTSGGVTLDFNGSEVRGYFEMSSMKDRDNIVCPFSFDEEWYVRMGGPGTSYKVVKQFTKGSNTPFIEISAFPGRAVLKN